MKTKQGVKKKDFDTVAVFRGIKEKISRDLAEKTDKQIMQYLAANSKKLQTGK